MIIMIFNSIYNIPGELYPTLPHVPALLVTSYQKYRNTEKAKYSSTELTHMNPCNSIIAAFSLFEDLTKH